MISYMKKGLRNFIKKILHYIELEGIPFLGSVIYNKIMKNFSLYNSILQKIASSELIKNIKGSILDIGTGPAYLTIYIARNNANCNIAGLDISPDMTKIAYSNVEKFNLMDRISLKIANAENIPFPDNFFNFVISTGSFHHWKNPIKVFNEIYRVLKPNCTAWIFDVINPYQKNNF